MITKKYAIIWVLGTGFMRNNMLIHIRGNMGEETPLYDLSFRMRVKC